MKTKQELEQRILDITAIIRKQFPELSKYINEMPDNNDENQAVNMESLAAYHESLAQLVSNYANAHKASLANGDVNALTNSGYPIYPPNEDIYKQAKQEKDLNPEDVSKRKAPNETEGSMNEKAFEDDMSGADLDVPGAELDNRQESMGNEDEENNHYSLGGDAHNNLEEDKG